MPRSRSSGQIDGGMTRSHLELFRLAGIPIRLHVSWLAIAALVVWTLAASAFPAEAPGLSAPTYWLMAVVGAAGLFSSIVIHEACHALVARLDGIPMSGITLFVFGGVAEMEGEPATPAAELRMAAAGPAASVVLALMGFGAVALLGGVGAGPGVVVLRYVALFNAVLAGFNLVPAFPLDGGRILRAALWWRTGDLQRATRVASPFSRVGMSTPAAARRGAPSWNISATGGLTSFIGLDEPAGRSVARCA